MFHQLSNNPQWRPELPRINFSELSPEEVLTLDNSIVIRLNAQVVKDLNHRFFHDIEDHIATIKKHLPTLKRIFDAKPLQELITSNQPARPKTKDRTEKLLILDVAIKVKNNPEKLDNDKRLSSATKEKITDAANRYLNCRDALVILNERLIFSTVKKYMRKFGVKKSSEKDLEQSGQFGLMDAIDRFDPNLNFEFGTYALPCINTRVHREVCCQNMIAIPRDLLIILGQINAEIELQKQTTGYVNLDKAAVNLGLKKSDLQEYLGFNYKILSTSEMITSRDTNTRFMEFFNMLYRDKRTPAEAAIDNEIAKKRKRIVQILLNNIDPKYHDIISERFALNNQTRAKTYKEIGQALNPNNPLSRQRVEQIVKQAIKQLSEQIHSNPDLLKEINSVFFD